LGGKLDRVGKGARHERRNALRLLRPTRFNQLCRMHAAQSKAIAMLSVKLRLTNSSHRNETFHERKLRTTPDGPRPWEQH
jgi:hypothetical protein